jgi:transcriptional regulator with XRE-family HTH domain
MLYKDRLRELRDAAGLTQEGLAKAADIPIGSVRNYEQGHRLPSVASFMRLAKALGTTCETFAGCADIAGAEEKPAPQKGKRK